MLNVKNWQDSMLSTAKLQCRDIALDKSLNI